MSWGIAFTSAKFLPTLPEDCQANPGVYGFELALWLAQALSRHGIVTGYPSGEDWGWYLDYMPSDELRLTIDCGSQCSAAAGYDGKPVDWSVYIRERRSLIQRVRNRSSDGALEALGQRIVDVLQAEQIAIVRV